MELKLFSISLKTDVVLLLKEVKRQLRIVPCKGAVIKYGAEKGGRDLTGSSKSLDGKCWANKLLQLIIMGHEAICFWICFQRLQLF